MASKSTQTHVTAIPLCAKTWAIELPIMGHISHLKYCCCSKTKIMVLHISHLKHHSCKTYLSGQKPMWQQFPWMQGHQQLNYQLLGTFPLKVPKLQNKLGEHKFKKKTENDSKWPLSPHKPMWQPFPSMQGHGRLNYQLWGSFLT